MSGLGKIRMHPDARVIVLPRCGNCARVAPECRCGMNAARSERA